MNPKTGQWTKDDLDTLDTSIVLIKIGVIGKVNILGIVLPEKSQMTKKYDVSVLDVSASELYLLRGLRIRVIKMQNKLFHGLSFECLRIFSG